MDRSKQTADIFDKYALAYQDKYMDLHLYEDSLEKFCNELEKKKARILEIGCGPGNITKVLLKKRPDLKILGIDLAPQMIHLAKINNPEAEFMVMDCREIAELDRKFDAVVCGFCLPYLSKNDSLRLIDNISELLNSRGLFYLSTMEARHNRSGYVGSSSGEENLYTWYHEAEYLRAHIKKNNFELLALSRIENPVYLDNSIKDLLILAKKS
ncbi:class I SAM-dependent DNA methyltransferase [Salegentibacter chungangensis]|uniref:Class I SAM-dependent DNA methyltransferase n=1 Tax=Salegentibacter chungangensis TaxID=1335724 RepID=A0ABW3NUW3_9FLAO